MKIGLGHLGLPPAIFWAMTLPEFMAACDGYLERKGATRSQRMTKADLEAARAGVDEQGALIRDAAASDTPRTPLSLSDR